MTAALGSTAAGDSAAGRRQPDSVSDVMDVERESGSEFTCPRCHRTVAARFYGPCPSCRGELIKTMRREAVDVERPVFEPAMNVVPNQVATKE
jgi:hypothetical protein